MGISLAVSSRRSACSPYLCWLFVGHLDYRIISESAGSEAQHDAQLCAHITVTKTRLLLRPREGFLLQILDAQRACRSAVLAFSLTIQAEEAHPYHTTQTLKSFGMTGFAFPFLLKP